MLELNSLYMYDGKFIWISLTIFNFTNKKQQHAKCSFSVQSPSRDEY